VNGPRPYTLVAELTYRCPLRCLYCSNPVELSSEHRELSTGSWQRVFSEAEKLGVVQLNLSGGEPLLRGDLEELIAHARRLDLYVSLITSGVPLKKARLEQLKAAGLDAMQLSIQGTEPELNSWVAGRDFHAQKLEVAGWARELDVPLTLNVVLHRRNLDRMANYIELALEMSAGRVELANTQYLGWALLNRDALLPSREQIDRARRLAHEARERLRGKLEVLFVLPDYFSDRPRACMNGWGRQFLLVAPDGRVLPCHQAGSLPGLMFENVESHSLEHIWNDSDAFRAFRGEDWMPEPCKSCDRRAIDFGGCRCQAYQLASDAGLTDPACALSPNHDIIERARESARLWTDAGAVRYRRLPVVAA
jgi:pyrroloquinoline quinone biosynthesis protein E